MMGVKRLTSVASMGAPAARSSRTFPVLPAEAAERRALALGLSIFIGHFTCPPRPDPPWISSVCRGKCDYRRSSPLATRRHLRPGSAAGLIEDGAHDHHVTGFAFRTSLPSSLSKYASMT